MEQEQSANIEALKNEATQQAEQIKSSLESVKNDVAELEVIKEEIRSKRLAVAQISTNAQTRDTEVQAAHANVTSLEKTAKEIVQKIEEKNIKLTDYLANFEAIRIKLDDDTDGLEATNVWVQQQKEEIGKLIGQARIDQATIAEIKSASEKDKEGISMHKIEVEGYRKEIEKIYGYINGQGLAHSFSDRQKKLRLPLVLWSIMLFVSTLLVSWSLYRVFMELPMDVSTGKRIFDPSSLFYRLSFVSPIILIFFVALRQYSRERRLLESYAFKAATAKALESYTEILARRFPEEKFRHRILAFVLHAMVGIYRHPNNELSKVDDEKEWAESFGEVADKITQPIVDTAKKAVAAVKKEIV